MKFILSKVAKKQLDKIPDHIFRKYLYWRDMVEAVGLLEARKYKGFHDEPLKGQRHDQRSVRLSKGYRLFYKLVDGNFEIFEILEVNKHEY